MITQVTLLEAILYAAAGMAVVMAILSLLAVLARVVSKAIAVTEKKKVLAEISVEPAQETPKATAPPQVAPQITLIDTDEATAAVLMAIVAERSGIPLNRLAFKSIKLLED